MEYKIKRATIENLKDVQTLNLKLFEKEYKEFDQTLDPQWPFSQDGETYFKRRLTEDDGCIFVAYLDNKIIGYLSGGLTDKSFWRTIPKTAELENMLVLEEYRGKGLGTKLYQAFVDWCKSKNVGRLQVKASAQNIKTLNFYRKNGFIDYDLILEADL